MKTLELKNIVKTYSQKRALDNVSLKIEYKKIHVFMGENGAGKTTLASIICGLLQPTSGDIYLDGKIINLKNTQDAYNNKIAIVHQNPTLAENLTVWQNIILGNEPCNFFGFINRNKVFSEIQKISDDWNIKLPLNSHIYKMSSSERFTIALLAALYRKPSLLILDEPTASLDERQRNKLFTQIKKSLDNGMSFILITHNMKEAINYGDTITIFKHGKIFVQIDNSKRDTKESEILNHIFGNPKIFSYKKNTKDQKRIAHTPFCSKKILEFKDVSVLTETRVSLYSIFFTVYAGMVTTILGQRESGMETLEELITGIIQLPHTGKIRFHDTDIKRLTPTILRNFGTSVVPFDKSHRASNPSLSVSEMLSIYETNRNNNIIAKQLISSNNIDIKLNEMASNLSGGMLQRLIVARELARKPNFVILSEPLQGLDFQSAENLAKRIRALADAGSAILILASSASHIAKFSDFILYISGGKITTMPKDLKK